MQPDHPMHPSFLWLTVQSQEHAIAGICLLDADRKDFFVVGVLFQKAPTAYYQGHHLSCPWVLC